jgi:Zn-dependent peptidase ImmA (M78 family)
MKINGINWKVKFTDRVDDLYLDGYVRFGVTDRNTNTIYLDKNLEGDMLKKVLLHELTHAWLFSYGYEMDVEAEEFLCSFVDSHVEEIFDKADVLLSEMPQNRAF